MKKITLILSLLTLLYLSGSGQNYVLYGLTSTGGTNNYGSLFSYNLTTEKDSVLLNFNKTNGATPYDNIVVNPNDGLLYAATTAGGANNYGVLFSYNLVTGKDSVRVNLDSSTTGKNPEYGSLTFYNNLFYGTALYGGRFGFGVLFGFNPVNNKDTIYANFDTLGQAYFPAGLTLTPYSNGLLYGTTYAGGSHNDGAIISFDPVLGNYTTVVSLDTALGIFPIEGTLTLDKQNNLLYGMTYKGGANNVGGIFCFNPTTGKDTLLFSFNVTNGSEPYGSLMYDTVNGLFYGMTAFGGSLSGGVMFCFNPITNKDSTLFNFTGPNGAVPLGDLILGQNNTLYGMTYYGGTSNIGVLFSYNTVTGKDTVLVNFNGTNGSRPCGSLTLALAPALSDVDYSSGTTSNLFIYPNPCNGTTHLIFNEDGKHEVEIDDITGRELASFECNGKQSIIPLNDMAKGIYFVKSFNSRNIISVSRLVVQ